MPLHLQFFCETCRTWLLNSEIESHINANPNHIASEKIRYVAEGEQYNEIDQAVTNPPPIVDPKVIESKKKYCVKEYVKNGKRLTKETWYETDNGDGTYSDKTEERVYTYNGNKLEKDDVTYYWPDGSVRGTVTTEYYSQGDNKQVVKRN